MSKLAATQSLMSFHSYGALLFISKNKSICHICNNTYIPKHYRTLYYKWHKLCRSLKYKYCVIRLHDSLQIYLVFWDSDLSFEHLNSNNYCEQFKKNKASAVVLKSRIYHYYITNHNGTWSSQDSHKIIKNWSFADLYK